jgi:predicted ATPase
MAEQSERDAAAPPIKRITIKRLFGDRDVDIQFDSPVMVLIADNGSGKTTILSMIYAVLSRQLYKLRKYTFDSITLETNTGRNIAISAEMAEVGVHWAKLEPRLRRLLDRFAEEDLFRLIDETRGLPLSEFRHHPMVRHMAEVAGMPAAYVLDVFHSGFKETGDQDDSGFLATESVRRLLAESFPYTNLYFPTYRRIEEELEDLGYTRKEGVRGEALIRFGMSDVAQRIKDITGKIEKSSVEWYSRISGEMLSQLVYGITVGDDLKRTIQDKSALKIVLDRVGNNISVERKLRIMQLVEGGTISQPKYETLVYFLANLIKVYDQQKTFDAAIKEFTRVCNKYLTDKHVVYNESTLDIRVVQKAGNKPVDLSKLSSGEKQIVSLFSRVYLENDNQLAVLFDEPELSLSIEWQKMLLPDIIESGRCQFLLATTHSPFIFENSLDKHAYDLVRYVRRIKA